MIRNHVRRGNRTGWVGGVWVIWKDRRVTLITGCTPTDGRGVINVWVNVWLSTVFNQRRDPGVQVARMMMVVVMLSMILNGRGNSSHVIAVIDIIVSVVSSFRSIERWRDFVFWRQRLPISCDLEVREECLMMMSRSRGSRVWNLNQRRRRREREIKVQKLRRIWVVVIGLISCSCPPSCLE